MDELTARAAAEAADQLERDGELGERIGEGMYLSRPAPDEVVLTVVGRDGLVRYCYGGVDWDAL